MEPAAAPLTDAERSRVDRIVWAVKWGRLEGLKDLSRADVALLAKRFEDLHTDGKDSAEELLQWLVRRLEEDLASQQEWLQECIANARTAELLVTEAGAALTSVKSLLAGGLYVAGDEIIKRWDAVEESCRARGLLPPDKPIEPPKAPPPAPPQEPAAVIAAPVEPKVIVPPPKPSGSWPAPVDHAEQDARMMAALKVAAGDRPEIQVSMKVLAEASGVAQGSAITVLRRLAELGRIEIVKNSPVGNRVPVPNTYRFVAADAPTAAPPALTISPPPVKDGPPLRDRIVAALASEERTTSSLATLLGVKELAVCQTLTAMEHEGRVSPGPMPEEGRRAQRWRAAAQH